MPTLRLHVLPQARRSEIVRRVGDTWWVRVAAPATQGKASQALIILLSEVLGLPKSDIRIVRGERARDKLVSIEGLRQDLVWERLSEHMKG